jgi:hypothetical protein
MAAAEKCSVTMFCMPWYLSHTLDCKRFCAVVSLAMVRPVLNLLVYLLIKAR